MMSSSSATTNLGLDTVNISLLSREDGMGKKALPLVISPRWDASMEFLQAWCNANRSWLDAQLLVYGAILLRGFDANGPQDIELAAQSFQPHLNDSYRGTSPRRLMQGTHFVFSAAEVPNNYPIAQHLEMSFLAAPPRQLFFGCVKPSKSSGGETALADFRQVYRDLSPALKQKFLDKGILYTRTHKKKGSYFTYDVADMLGWAEMFGSNSKAEVERMCAAEGIPVQWKGRDKDTFVSSMRSQAFQLHPVTGEHVWFNHTQVFHWTTFPAELFFAWQRTCNWRLLLHCIFVTIFSVIKYGILGHKMALHCTFGDGEPISVAEMQEIRKAIHKNMIFNRWEKGDLLMIDNFSTSHGRQPTYDKGRKIVVAWADPLLKANAVTSIEPLGKQTVATGPPETTEEIIVEEEVVYYENPQEKTPESTLTNADSQKLQHELQSKLFEESAHKKLVADVGTTNPQDFDTFHRLKTIVNEAERSRSLTKSHSQPIIPDSDFWRSAD